MSQQRTTSLDRFKRLTEDLQKECLQVAKTELTGQADKLVDTMKNAAPVSHDPRDNPGALRKSIAWTFGVPPKTRATGAFRPTRSSTGMNVYAGDDVAFYARWVEFGTAPHSLSKGSDRSRKKYQSEGTQHPGAVAKPFFWPSYRLMKKSIRGAVKRKLAASIKKRSAQ